MLADPLEENVFPCPATKLQQQVRDAMTPFGRKNFHASSSMSCPATDVIIHEMGPS
jgi:hypothetical protein